MGISEIANMYQTDKTGEQFDLIESISVKLIFHLVVRLTSS
jgi:hypothetical protein